MTDLIWCATLKGAPRTKKNHQRILHDFGGRPFVDHGKAFDDYERSYIARIKTPYRPVSAAVNATCLYYMPAAAAGPSEWTVLGPAERRQKDA